MAFGFAWYWWLGIVLALAAVIAVKVKFAVWWADRRRQRAAERRGKWGDGE